MKPIAIILTSAIMLLFAGRATAQTASNQQSATLNHIAIYVTDLDRSAAFYENVLHLQKIEEPFKDGRHVWFSMGSAGQVHIISGAKTNLTYDKNEHLCFSVSSMADFIAQLDKKNINFINWEGTAKAPTIRVDGVKQIYFQDPDGHWLEVNDQKKFK